MNEEELIKMDELAKLQNRPRSQLVQDAQKEIYKGISRKPGQTIKALRELHEWSQVEIAEKQEFPTPLSRP